MNLTRTELMEPFTTESHASCICFHEGKRVVAWFGGVQEGMQCGIFIQTEDLPVLHIPCPVSPPESTWVNSLWNPILISHDKQLILMFKSGTFCDRWQTHVFSLSVTSSGADLVWSQMLPAGLHGATKAKPIVLPDGTLLCGSSTETHESWSCHVEKYVVEPDRLRIVGRSLPMAPNPQTYGKGIIQPALWNDGKGKLHMLCRSACGYLFQSEAWIDSSCWSPPVCTTLENPNSGVDVLKHSNGKQYLAYNPSKTLRSPLMLAEFEINNHDVKLNDQLLIGDTEMYRFHTQSRTKELSYPNLVEAPDGVIQMSYTNCRSIINVAHIQV